MLLRIGLQYITSATAVSINLPRRNVRFESASSRRPQGEKGFQMPSFGTVLKFSKTTALKLGDLSYSVQASDGELHRLIDEVVLRHFDD